MIAWIHDNLCYSRKPIVLQEWQKDIFRKLFGWRNPCGGLRWKKASVWIPKKNGKSFLAAIILILRLIHAGEYEAQHYSCATSLNQAGIVFKDALNIVKTSPKLQGSFKYYDTAAQKRIIYLPKESEYRVVSSKKDGQDGIKSTTFLEDELHLISDDYHTVVSGSVIGIPDSLHLIISTAGKEPNETFCGYREFLTAQKIISDKKIDIHTLPIIYAVEPSDDIEYLLDLETALKANPRAREDDVHKQSLITKIAEYRDYPETINKWKRYHLNIWANDTDGLWIQPERYAKQLIPNEDEITSDTPCWIGIDLSKLTDLTGVSLLFEVAEDRFIEKHYGLMPEDRVDHLSKIDKVDYKAWIARGWIATSGKEIIEHNAVAAFVADLLERYNVQGIGVDVWNCSNFIQIMQAEYGVAESKILGIYQSAAKLSPFIKEYQSWILTSKLWHVRNDCYTWQLASTQTKGDANENVKLIKQRARRDKSRKDNCSAIVDAMAMRDYQLNDEKEKRNNEPSIAIIDIDY